MKRIIPRAFALWLPILAATSALFLASYWGLQQQYRVSLNDPQVQMAEDAATALTAGETPGMIVPTGTPVDLARSLAPWIAIYDASGTVLGSDAVFTNDQSPRLPAGVFDTATWKKAYGEWGIALAIPASEDRFTWQPRADVRQAVVLIRVTDPASAIRFVAAGRNMREVESRIQTLSAGYALAWSAGELGTLLLLIILLALGWL